MKKIVVALTLLLVSFAAVPVVAAQKVVVVPLSTGRMQQELVPLAQGEINTYSGDISSTGSYGISSVVLDGVGKVTVTFTTSWVGYPAVMTGGWGSSHVISRLVYYSARRDSNIIDFYTKSLDTGALIGGYFSFVVYGQKQ